VGGIGEEGGAGRHRVQDARLALDAEIVGQAAAGGDESDQGFGLVGVEVVGEEEPTRVGVGVDGLSDVRGEVLLGAARAKGGGKDRPGGDVEGGDQAEGAVADVLVFAAFGAAGAHGLGGCRAFERLEAGHLVGADHMTAEGFQHRGVGVGRTNGLDGLSEGGRVRRLGLGVEPVAAPVRLELGLHLKSVRPNGARWWRRCPA